MRIADHVEKIARLDGLRGRLDPLLDFELWFWATMTAGTHAVNAALHHARVTQATDAYPTQPGVYLVPRDGDLQPAFGPLGDILHVGRPAIEAPMPADVEQIMHAMERIEAHRDPCVRGGRKPTPAIANECEEALRSCLALLDHRLLQLLEQT